jgi:hypothetical protein
MGLWDVGNNDEKGERRVVLASGRATAVQTSTHAAGVVVREALTNLKERVRIEGLQRQLDKLKRVAAQSCVVMAPLVSSPRVHRTNKSMLSVGDTIGIMALAPRPAACVGAHRWIGLIVIACGFGGHDGRNERHDIGCASSSGSRKPAFYRHAALNELLVAIAYWARARTPCS